MSENWTYGHPVSALSLAIFHLKWSRLAAKTGFFQTNGICHLGVSDIQANLIFRYLLYYTIPSTKKKNTFHQIESTNFVHNFGHVKIQKFIFVKIFP